MNLVNITVSRRSPAPPEKVYDRWIDPLSPGGPWFGVARVILSQEVDGLFYHAAEYNGKNWPHYGRFLALDRPNRIERTWVSEATKGIESKIVITLERSGDETELFLHHSDVPDDEMGRSHEQGWKWVLPMLASSFAPSFV